MDPRHRSIPEAAAYRIVGVVLVDLQKAEQILAAREALAPDPARAQHLARLRAAIQALAPLAPCEPEPPVFL